MSVAPPFHYHRLREEDADLREWEVDALFAVRRNNNGVFSVSAAVIDPSFLIDPAKNFSQNIDDILTRRVAHAQTYDPKDQDFIRAYRAGVRQLSRDRFYPHQIGPMPRLCLDTLLELTRGNAKDKLDPKQRVAPGMFTRRAVESERGHAGKWRNLVKGIESVPKLPRALSYTNTLDQEKVAAEAVDIITEWAVRNYAYRIHADAPFLVRTQVHFGARVKPPHCMTSQAFRAAHLQSVSPEFDATRPRHHPASLWNALVINKLISGQGLPSIQDAQEAADAINCGYAGFRLAPARAFG